MNGVHDMGGMDGFGAVVPDPHEPLFHAPWEARALALTIAAGGLRRWTLNASRHARERIPAADYLRMSYYERWIAGLERLLEETGLATAAELASLRADGASAEVQPLAAGAVPAALARGGPTLREGPPPRFAVGQRVRTRNLNPLGHTRLPRYLRDKAGEVVRLHGAHTCQTITLAAAPRILSRSIRCASPPRRSGVIAPKRLRRCMPTSSNPISTPSEALREAPVFAEPWQARAFALAAALQDAGLVTRAQWTDAFSAAIADSEAAGRPVDAERYHQLWVETLLALVADSSLATAPEVETRRAAWEAAWRRTPHGRPVEL